MIRTSKEWNSLPTSVKNDIEAVQAEIPVKVGDLAKRLGISVKIATLDVGISGMIKPAEGLYKITINKHEPTHRRRFTLAHEISHYLLHRDLIGDGISDNILYRSRLSDAVEAEANRLASDILMPPTKIEEWRAKVGEPRMADAVSPLADRFGVSEEAMRIRLGMKK